MSVVSAVALLSFTASVSMQLCFFELFLEPVILAASSRREAVAGTVMVLEAAGRPPPATPPPETGGSAGAKKASPLTTGAAADPGEMIGSKPIVRPCSSNLMYSFKLPPNSGFEDRTSSLDASAPPGLIHLERRDGSSVSVGPLLAGPYMQAGSGKILEPAPGNKFYNRVQGQYEKVQYSSKEGQEDLEMRVGVQPNWAHLRKYVRILRDGDAGAMMVLEGFRYETYRPTDGELEAILSSFRLGA